MGLPTNNPNLQRMIRESMYRLKLEFGALVDVYRLNSSSTDYDTGAITRSITRRRVRRAVKLPEGVSRQQYISPYFTQTNKFAITKGLGWDEVTNVFLFDGKDLEGFNFELEDWLVWNHERFEIKAVEELGNKSGWAIGTTYAKGSPAEEIFEEIVSHVISIEQSSSPTRVNNLSSSISFGSVSSVEKAINRSVTTTVTFLDSSDAELAAFISTWNTANTASGTSASNQVQLPLVSTGTYNFVVNWGDGTQDTITSWSDPAKLHTYSSPGTYNISINGTCTGWRFNNAGDRTKLTEISNWGPLKFVDVSAGGYFYGCSNLTDISSTVPLDMSGITSMDNAFRGCSSLSDFSTANIDFSAVTRANGCWQSCSGFTSFPVISLASCEQLASTWQGCSGLTSFPAYSFPAATNLFATWRDCTSMTTFGGLSNVNLVTSASNGWRGCSALTSFPGLALPACTDFTASWFGCSGLTSFPSGVDFTAGQNFTQSWNSCTGLLSFPALNLPAATNFSRTWQFSNKIASVGLLQISAATNLAQAFEGCTLLKTLDSNQGAQFGAMTDGTNMFNGVTLNTSVYDDLLVGMESVNSNTVTFHGGSSKYTSTGQTARNALIADHSWTITDGGLA